MKHFALFLAGGTSQRMDGIVHDKILAEISGKPIIAYSLQKFHSSGIIDGCAIIYRDSNQLREIQTIVAKILPKSFPVFYAQGGKERSESVRAGLNLIPESTEFVYIHDCARPAIRLQTLIELREAVVTNKCAVAVAKQATDTIKSFEGDPTNKSSIAETLDRKKLWVMETPQAFPRSLIDTAHHSKNSATDDLALVEAMGEKVLILENKHPNLKLTTPSDLILIEAILNAENPMINANDLRIGHGYDIHQLVPNRKLILGGIEIPSDLGLLGHSDADVLSHAVADAILGALGLPDIGHYFPNSDPTIAGINSQKILTKCLALATEEGFKLINLDTSIVAEKPKITAHIQSIKNSLSKTLGISPQSIGIKATTNEKMGSLGAGLGIAAYAVVLLRS